jgi:hypothetical protein
MINQATNQQVINSSSQLKQPTCVPLPHPLPQAISYLRQKQVSEAAKALNNLVSCEAAVPSEGPVSWRSSEELSDLYSCYVSKVGAGCWLRSVVLVPSAGGVGVLKVLDGFAGAEFVLS